LRSSNATIESIRALGSMTTTLSASGLTPQRGDAVEKVGDGAPARNNRIASDDFLNRTCAFGGRINIVQRTPSKSFFNNIGQKRTLDQSAPI
jgi:hypothetical protein